MRILLIEDDETTAAYIAKGLRQAGFYGEWKAKFGDEAWALLERYSGKLG